MCAANWTPCSATCGTIDGVSVLIYDQVCATEKRRRRKRGKMARGRRSSVMINTEVCENCGDCSTQSGCIAIEPVETALGRKRRINPTACNVDLSCLKGFCPSFVTVAGPPRAPDADPRWAAREAELAAALPEPRAAGRDAMAGAVRRHRRRRHRHLRRDPGHGGASGRPGGQNAGLHRAGAEERRGRRACADRSSAASSTWCAFRLGEARVMLAADLAVGAGPGVLERCGDARRGDRQSRSAGHRGVQVRSAPGDRCRAAPAHDRESHERRAQHVSARRAAGRATVRQCAGDEHDAAGLGLAARPGAGGRGCDPARDRAERRGGGAEPARVPVGPHPG